MEQNIEIETQFFSFQAPLIKSLFGSALETTFKYKKCFWRKMLGKL